MPPPIIDSFEPPELFAEAEAHFQELHATIAAETVRLVARGDDSPADMAAATAAVERLHSEVDDLLKQMNVDARTASDAVARKKLLARVELYQRGIKALRAEFVRAKEDAARYALLGGRPGGGVDEECYLDELEEMSQQKERLLATSASLAQQNSSLNQSLQTLEETEAVAFEITQELQSNREKIERARERVRDVDSLTSAARRMIAAMSRREAMCRVIFVTTGLVVLVGGAVLAYFVLAGR